MSISIFNLRNNYSVRFFDSGNCVLFQGERPIIPDCVGYCDLDEIVVMIKLSCIYVVSLSGKEDFNNMIKGVFSRSIKATYTIFINNVQYSISIDDSNHISCSKAEGTQT